MAEKKTAKKTTKKTTKVTIDQEKINEERRAYLEEARSQEASD
jgi:hypothetical protein